jgi:hypothetical protein
MQNAGQRPTGAGGIFKGKVAKLRRGAQKKASRWLRPARPWERERHFLFALQSASSVFHQAISTFLLEASYFYWIHGQTRPQPDTHIASLKLPRPMS